MGARMSLCVLANFPEGPRWASGDATARVSGDRALRDLLLAGQRPAVQHHRGRPELQRSEDRADLRRRSEGTGKVGEGPCNASTGVCQNATTEGRGACPSNNFTSGSLCEFSDMTRVPAGPRPVNFNGTLVKESWPISGCQMIISRTLTSILTVVLYIRDWPNGSPSHPTSFAYMNVTPGTGCTVPPAGARFYPFRTLANGGRLGCIWNFGDVIPGQTKATFGCDARYGTADVARYGGTLASPVLANPQTRRSC